MPCGWAVEQQREREWRPRLFAREQRIVEFEFELWVAAHIKGKRFAGDRETKNSEQKLRLLAETIAPTARLRDNHCSGRKARASATLATQRCLQKAETSQTAQKATKHTMKESATYPLTHLMDEIATEQNVGAAFDYIVGHLENAPQREKYRPLRATICAQLLQELSDGTFRITEFINMTVTDGPKVREVQAPSVYCRIGCHAIMVVVEKHCYPTLIHNTAASIKGRGMHWLHHILEDDARNAPEQTKYYYQSDVRHYYDSIPQGKMKAMIREYIADETLLPMLDNFVELLPEGISKGLRSSQCFANLYLNELDHVMQEEAERYILTRDDGEEECRALYYRYCDDIVMMAGDKRTLWRLRGLLVEKMTDLGLEIKANEAVRPLSVGLDYLGYVHFGTHSLLRKRTKQNAARKLARIKSRKRRQEVIGSFKGMACHADCKHLFHTLTAKRMRKFGEMGITYAPADGKKRFIGNKVRLSTIQNKPIEVHDYEKGIHTSHGEDRYVVSFRDILGDAWGKFFTGSEEMKNVLDQVSEIDGFPFETVIVSEVFDGTKTKYKFT